MRRLRTFAAVWLIPVTFVAYAAHVSVELVSEDVAHGTVTIAVENGEPQPIEVCFSDQLSRALPNGGNPKFAPFYWEKQSGHKWSMMIGTDVALYALGPLGPGKREEYSVAMPQHGRYRAVMYYAGNTQLVVDCVSLYSGKYSRAVSHPLEIPDHPEPEGAHEPKLIPRP